MGGRGQARGRPDGAGFSAAQAHARQRKAASGFHAFCGGRRPAARPGVPHPCRAGSTALTAAAARPCAPLAAPQLFQPAWARGPGCIVTAPARRGAAMGAWRRFLVVRGAGAPPCAPGWCGAPTHSRQCKPAAQPMVQRSAAHPCLPPACTRINDHTPKRSHASMSTHLALDRVEVDVLTPPHSTHQRTHDVGNGAHTGLAARRRCGRGGRVSGQGAREPQRRRGPAVAPLGGQGAAPRYCHPQASSPPPTQHSPLQTGLRPSSADPACSSAPARRRCLAAPARRPPCLQPCSRCCWVDLHSLSIANWGGRRP